MRNDHTFRHRSAARGKLQKRSRIGASAFDRRGRTGIAHQIVEFVDASQQRNFAMQACDKRKRLGFRNHIPG
jgi:hypothetical protein